MSNNQENYKTHTILQPSDCKCDGERNCNICDGGLSFCTVCRGGEIELEEQTCEERLRERNTTEPSAYAMIHQAAKETIVHTPGPWKIRKPQSVHDISCCEYEIVGVHETSMSRNREIKVCGIHNSLKGNVKLIAAAPDLLKELRQAVEMLENTIDTDPPACDWWKEEVARLKEFVKKVV